MLSSRDMAPRLSIHSPTTEWGGGRWWRQPPKGKNAEMVPEVYDSLFLPSYLSFPLEGKSREAGKGVRGRAPIGWSIAVLTANRRPPERSDATFLHNLWHQGPEARWMPYAPLRRRRRPLREYWKAPPKSRSRSRPRSRPRHRRLNPHARQGLSIKAVNPSASRPQSGSFSSTTGTPALTRASASTPRPLIFFPLKVPS